MYSDPRGTTHALDNRIMFANAGGAIDVTPLFFALIGVITESFAKANAKEQEEIVVAAEVAKKNDYDAIFTPNTYDFCPNGLVRHVYVDVGQGRNGGIIKWELPGTRIAVFEWNEDLQNGAHYHTIKVEWENRHYGPHYPIGSVVPEPWQSIYFGDE